MKVSHEIHSTDFIRISSFLENTKKLFDSINFIKNFEVLNILLFIYRNQLIKEKVNFKILQNYIKKSDVYLSHLLKDGLETGYLTVSQSEIDKRVKHYQVTEKATAFFNNLNFEADYP